MTIATAGTGGPKIRLELGQRLQIGAAIATVTYLGRREVELQVCAPEGTSIARQPRAPRPDPLAGRDAECPPG
jgi:hypothetical protein